MNDKNRRQLDSGQRCRQWTVDYVALIPHGTIFETKGVAMNAKVDQLEDLAGELEAAKGEGLSSTDVKSTERQDLIDAMKNARNAARAAEFDHPGTRDRYRYSTNMSDQGLLAAGRGFVESGINDEDLLESYGAPDKWNIAIDTACDAYEASFNQQDSAQGSRIGLNATIDEGVKELQNLKASFGHMVKNYASADTGALAAWTAAAHVESPPKKAKPPTPPAEPVDPITDPPDDGDDDAPTP